MGEFAGRRVFRARFEPKIGLVVFPCRHDECVRRSGSGRPAAREPFVRKLAKSLLFDQHEVDDVVQQTWLEALKVARGSRSWLATVVRTRASNVRREAGRRRVREAREQRVEALPSPAELMERDELRRQVVTAVSQLPEKLRVVVLLRFYEGLPPRRIAAELGLPRNTVATRLKRGLQQLRERLDAEHDGHRQQWAIGLVPLAVPLAPKGAAAALVASVAAWVWAMKHLVIAVVSVAAFLFGLGLATNWFGQGAVEPDGRRSESAGCCDRSGCRRCGRRRGRRNVRDDRSRVAVPSRSAPRTMAPSVQAAMSGFRGRVVTADGRPAAGELVRLLGVDPVHAMGSVFDPDERAQGRLPVGPESHAVCTGRRRPLSHRRHLSGHVSRAARRRRRHLVELAAAEPDRWAGARSSIWARSCSIGRVRSSGASSTKTASRSRGPTSGPPTCRAACCRSRPSIACAPVVRRWSPCRSLSPATSPRMS